jgi:hypothetical protein
MATVALATTHQAHEPEADLVVSDLSALSALVTGRGVRISVRSRGLSTAVRMPDSGSRSPLFVCFTDRMTTTSCRTLATEATMTPGARCMCRMCAF